MSGQIERGQQRNTNSIRASEGNTKYDEGRRRRGIGLIVGDKYGSRGQLAHTWLLSLGEWGLPLYLLAGSGFCPADNAANFAPIAAT